MRPVVAIAAALALAGCNTTSSFNALDPVTWAAPVDPMAAYRLKPDDPAPAPSRPAMSYSDAVLGGVPMSAPPPTSPAPFAPPMIFCDTLPPLGEGDPAITD